MSKKKHSRFHPPLPAINSTGPHMIRTEALSLDEACEILVANKAKRTRYAKRSDAFADSELDTKVPVTLPKLKFMGE